VEVGLFNHLILARKAGERDREAVEGASAAAPFAGKWARLHTDTARGIARVISAVPAVAALFAGTAVLAQQAPAPNESPPTPVKEVVVVPRTPIAGADVGAADVPASVTTITARDIARQKSQNIVDVLLQRVPSVTINSETGNDFEPDVQFRGFIATPLSGVPEGLAVYQDGVRINEAFGDNVGWDLIPTVAIDQMQVITDNPVFGLNALGGAIDLKMKSGFTFHGFETDIRGGSFGRVQDSTQAGWRSGPYSAYVAVEAAHEDGWRDFTPSTVRRIYGDFGYRTNRSELHVGVTAADNAFGAAGSTPIQLLQQNYASVFTTPQTDNHQMAMVSLREKYAVTDTSTLSGTAYYRRFDQHHVDGNGTDAQPCDANPALLCFGDGVTPANGANGRQLANPFGPNETPGEIDTNSTVTDGFGAALQATSTAGLFGLANNFVIGASVDAARTQFHADAELGVIQRNFVVVGDGIYLGASGVPVSDGPVRLIAHNTYVGVYALDTLDLTSRFSITGGGRFNFAQLDLDDQLGGALTSQNHYDRFDPVIGATFKITPDAIAYAGYSESNRAPTPLELGCANPDQPCIIDSFLVSDPPLKQVVSRTVEAGLRGAVRLASPASRINWQLALYRTDNGNDILNIPSPLNNGFGYFANVGGTRREGLDVSIDYTGGGWIFYASYAYVDATYPDALTLAAPGGDPFADANGNISVVPGDHISSIPHHRVKVGFDREITSKWTFGGDVLWVSSEYYSGDESNQNPQLPGHATVNLHTSYQITPHFQIYGLIDNLFDHHYYTFATFFDNSSYVGNPSFPNLTDTRSLTPGKPFAAYGGLKITF
jgi:outer membrane receptor protein involved in Fe transport